MSPPTISPASESIQEAAALWFARLRGESVSADDRAEFAAWLAENPVHGEEYALLEQIWDSSAQLQSRPRSLGPGLKAVAMVVLALGVGGYVFLAQPTTTLATVAGERRHIQLDDGSQLDLAPQTRVVVRMDGRQRRIELERGQIAIGVASDPERPFEVMAGKNRIRDIGTRFGVDSDGEKVRVSVEEGVVEVESGNGRQEKQQLHAGEEVVVDDGKFSPVARVDRSISLAWTKGQLIFEDQPLSEVIAALNRFRTTPIVLDDPRDGQLRISGVFLVDDERTAPMALERITSLRFEEAGGQRVARHAALR